MIKASSEKKIQRITPFQTRWCSVREVLSGKDKSPYSVWPCNHSVSFSLGKQIYPKSFDKRIKKNTQIFKILICCSGRRGVVRQLWLLLSYMNLFQIFQFFVYCLILKKYMGEGATPQHTIFLMLIWENFGCEKGRECSHCTNLRFCEHAHKWYPPPFRTKKKIITKVVLH